MCGVTIQFGAYFFLNCIIKRIAVGRIQLPLLPRSRVGLPFSFRAIDKITASIAEAHHVSGSDVS